MAITQVGVATVSDELLEWIKEQIKEGTLEWSDLTDTPDYIGNDGKFLQAISGEGSSSMAWQDLPTAGLNWQVESTDFQADDKIGILASNGITITLPLEPVEGTIMAVADHISEFDTNPVTIACPSGFLIEGEDELILDLRNAYVQLVFDGVQWELTQINHPFNIQEITEESFPGGQQSYTLSRIPPSRSSILVTNNGYVRPSSTYALNGNVLSFGAAPVGTVFVRHIGVPAAVKVSDTPIGAMIYFPNGEEIDGWLDCTGGSISRSVYPDLVHYLTKDPDAEIAYLPDARGNFIRTWAHGLGVDSVAPQNIPSYLKTNDWGKWIDTTEPGTSSNLWDGSTVTRTTVLYDQGYVGYRFDAPVSISQINITCNDAISLQHLPTSIQLKASTDGLNWIDASIPFAGTMQAVTVQLDSTVDTEYRFWAVFGTGGIPYPDNTDYYWGVTSLVLTGASTNRLIGGFQDQAVGPIEMTLNGTSAGAGQVQSGEGAIVPLEGGSGTVGGGATDTRPNNQAYILRIKAFHYQSGELTSTDVTSLRGEVSRLSALINDLSARVQ